MVHISNKKAAKQQLNMENQKIEGSTEQVTWMLNTVHLAWHIFFLAVDLSWAWVVGISKKSPQIWQGKTGRHRFIDIGDVLFLTGVMFISIL